MIKNIFNRPIVKGKDQVIDGVCSGFANSFQIDAFWIRLLFLMGFLIFDPLDIIIIYIFLSFLMKDYTEETK